MKKNISIAILGVVIILLSVLWLRKEGTYGAGAQGLNTYNNATNSSSSLTASVAATLLSTSATRMDATICFLTGTSTVFLHPLATTATSSVTVNTGIALSTTTASYVPSCQTFPGFRGNLFGISASPATVTISSHN